MSTKNDTLAELLALIHTQYHLEVSGVTCETGLADVGLDSLAVAELLFAIEEKFGINLGEIPPETMPATVGEIIDMINAHPSRA